MDEAERWLLLAVFMICLLIGALFYPVFARAEEFPHLTCPVVRDLVAQHGKAKSLDYAIKNGATKQQIKGMRKCLSR